MPAILHGDFAWDSGFDFSNSNPERPHGYCIRNLGRNPFWKAVYIAGTLFLYVLLFNWLGFLLGTFLLLLVLFRIVEPYGWKTILLSSVLTIAGTYFFFDILLESRLPKGFLGF
ncbi:MAG: tripartite tricarboxylate transporter TctB family protein [Thermodesulfobacteriota bacterium]